MIPGITNVAPCFDDATYYSYAWNDGLRPMLTGIRLSFLAEYATRANYREHIRDYETLIFYDHGAEDGLIAQPEVEGEIEYLLDMEDTPNLADMRIYTMACSSAKQFGLEAYKHGCKEYWGAISPIGFVPADEVLFAEVYNTGAYLRFEVGMSIVDVLTEMENLFNEKIDEATDFWTKVWLTTDRDIWRCWSDETPPDENNTNCSFRKLAVKLFGVRGWKIPSLTMLRRKYFGRAS